MPRDADLPIEPYWLHKDTADFVAEIQRAKYMQPGEARWEDLHRRVTVSIFNSDGQGIEYENGVRFEAELNARVACPAGRILAGVGTGRNVTYFNCYISPLLQDSMRTDPSRPGKGIMDALADVAYSMQMGGGVGTDFSPLRPKGALVKRLNASASGPLAFMDMWDAMCRTVMSAGSRRGAMMSTLRCDHPDLLEFITAKRDPNRLRMFNVSVLVTDAFMQAVKDDGLWNLGHWEPPFDREATAGIIPHQTGQGIEPWYVYHQIPARRIWGAIMRSTYDHAEPGVIFIDRINHWNNLYYCEDIQCTNPCFAAETLIVTDRGAFPIEELAERAEPVTVWDGERWVVVNSFRETGRDQPMLKISLRDGCVLRVTPYHVMRLDDGSECEAKDLMINASLKRSHTHIYGSKCVVTVEEDGVDDRVYCCTVPGSHSIALGIGIVTGQCGEQAMAPDDACNLCHINLSRCITGTPFTDTCRIDFERIDRVTRLLVRQADRIIDISPLATEGQELAVKNKRRIGLGVTGLANLMMFMRVRYGSLTSCALVTGVMRTIRDSAYLESIELAKEKGSFPLFDCDKYLDGNFVKMLPRAITDGICMHGIRNSLLLSLAPTGTVSLAQCDNCSSGIEPVFSARYTRKVLQPDGSYRESRIEDFGFRVYANVMHNGDLDVALNTGLLPDYMVTTADLMPEDHLQVQATAQLYVDNSISKTVNVPQDISFEDFCGVYERAYELGCKSCTTYRPNPESGRGSILSIEDTETLKELLGQPISSPIPPLTVEESQREKDYLTAPIDQAGYIDFRPRAEQHRDPDYSSLRKRPDRLDGSTYRLRWGSLPYPMFLTINDEVQDDGRRVPFEIFINSKAVDYAHWVSALTRMISAVMRKGGDLSFIPDELKAVWSARGGEMVGQRFIPSEVALIGIKLEEHFREIGYMDKVEPVVGASREEVRMTGVHYAETGVGRECPSCGALQVIRSEGCDKCLQCGWSNCG